MADDVQMFREKAEECRQEAAKAVSPVEAERWRRLADEWLKLAQSAERRRP
jgi:hypothetical protein